MARPTMIPLTILLILAAAAGAEPTVSELLALKPEGMNEGDRMQNAAYCLEAGQHAREQEKFGLALDLFNKCLELNGEETEAHLQKAIIFGDDRIALRAQAMAELRLFLATNPRNGQALALLGWEYKMKGKIAEAEQQYKLAVARDPGDPWNLARYGDLLVGFTDRVQEGIDCTLTAVAGGNTEPWPQMILAHGYVRMGKYAEARACAARAIAGLRAHGEAQPIQEMNRLLRAIEGK